jgi:SAM-dependent methyltransferase
VLVGFPAREVSAQLVGLDLSPPGSYAVAILSDPKMLKALLTHPRTRGLDIDDPRTTELRRSIIREKPFLRQVYEEWYAAIVANLPPCDGPVLELGSGAGFLRDYVAGLITSDVFPLPGVSAVLDAHSLPFADASLRAIVMTNVLHHLPRPRRFFAEAARCVKPGGRMIMIEPWVTPWSKLIFQEFHHEPFDPDAAHWDFPTTGPLSGANGAIPWVLFVRDRAALEREFPLWQVQAIRPMMPFRYLLSGGVSLRALMPGWTFRFWRRLENRLQPWMNTWGMFAEIVLVRLSTPGGEKRATPGAEDKRVTPPQSVGNSPHEQLIEVLHKLPITSR